MAQLLLFADGPDWHAQRLAEACTARGANLSICALRECAFRIGANAPAIAIPGFEQRLPDAVIVRTVGLGSFEQVTLRLSLLHALAMSGIPVVNDARAIERCVDKSMTSFLLQRAGIPTPPTLVTESRARAARLHGASHGDLVLKPLFGSQGRGMARLAPGEDLPAADAWSGVYYLQRYIGRDAGWRDYRVFVIGGRPVAAMIRHGRSWVTNVAHGAVCEAVPCSGELAALGLAAAQAVSADFAGVDLLADDAGELQVLEVNSMPAWRGLQSVVPIDLADLLVAHVLAYLA